jgi:membrane-bound ClpP family serine protease
MQGRANRLLIYKIVSTAFEETMMALAVLWLLPKLDINIPPWLLLLAMPALAAYNVFTYRKGIEALRTKPLAGMTSMVGIEGKVVRHLAPEGTIKIRGELWTAEAASGSLDEGRRVVVVGQKRLRLTVEAVGGASGGAGDSEEQDEPR